MAGIYLHIPFCKQACNYCDFHFSTSLKNKMALLQAMKKEMQYYREAWSGEPIKTVYLGGGTPSLLNASELDDLFETLAACYDLSAVEEITLEANPDDLSPGRIRELINTPVNRLSIGTQSFFDEDLRFMNRAHNAREALESIVRAQDAGFDNITIDLIYGVPTLTNDKWLQNLEEVRRLNIPHLSAYCLTVEPRTVLYHDINKGKIPSPDENSAVEHFRELTTWAGQSGFVHYEISNLGKEGYFSRHNTSYWEQEKYLGLGPAAHSYDGTNRWWNVRNNAQYIRAMETGIPQREEERLSLNDRFNEYLMTSLRTIWGISEKEVVARFGPSYWKEIETEIKSLLGSGEIILSGNKITLSEKGKLVADKIAAHLFVTE